MQAPRAYSPCAVTVRILGEALSSLPPGRYEIPVRGDSMSPTLRDGDVVLVKASRGVGLDTVVDGLRRHLGGQQASR